MNSAGTPIVLEVRHYFVAITFSILLVSCNETEPPRASFIAVPNINSTYGHLITVANARRCDGGVARWCGCASGEDNEK